MWLCSLLQALGPQALLELCTAHTAAPKTPHTARLVLEYSRTVIAHIHGLHESMSAPPLNNQPTASNNQSTASSNQTADTDILAWSAMMTESVTDIAEVFQIPPVTDDMSLEGTHMTHAVQNMMDHTGSLLLASPTERYVEKQHIMLSTD